LVVGGWWLMVGGWWFVVSSRWLQFGGSGVSGSSRHT
jgi:hypothetical protein